MKLTQTQAVLSVLACTIVSFLVLSVLWYVKFPFDTIEKDGLSFGAIHLVTNVLWVIATIGLTIFGLVKCDDDDRDSPFYESDIIEIPKMKKKFIVWIIIILAVIGIYGVISPAISESISMYNTSISYQNLYKQKTDEKLGFYDKLWKVYLQKNQIAELNKDVFLEVTKLIMEGRSDGDKVAWKWVQENQQIPYTEFTKFYSDLSEFVFSQREAYFKIEQECMQIANRNNTMLEVFPNNIYNKILGLKRIEFKYSFTSKKSKEVFATGEENIELYVHLSERSEEDVSDY